MPDETTVTEEVARRYFAAWTAHDRHRTAELLSPGFQFTARELSVEGRDAFLDAGGFPQDASVTMVAEAYQGAVAFQMYDATRVGTSVRIVEQLTVHDGRIGSSTFVTDTSAFMAFLSAEPGAPSDS